MNAKMCKERFKEKNTVDHSHLLLLPAQILRSDLKSKTCAKGKKCKVQRAKRAKQC
jgi:hypothetical protein